MKKIFVVISALFCLLLFPGLNAMAENYEDYNYEVRDGTVTITYYNGNAASLSIPSTIDGKKVTDIGERAFQDCKSLKNITLPNGIKQIGFAAFLSCSNLENVYIPDSLTVIGESAFSNCTSLNKINIPRGITYLNDTFYGCTNLQNIVIPGNVKNIETNAFSGCSNLNTVTIEKGVETIGNGAFYQCTALKSISIPYGVKEIGFSAFGQCKNLEKISIPGSVNKIRDDTFDECPNISELVLQNGIQAIETAAFDQCKKLKSVTIPGSVKVIGSSAFKECSSLSTVILQDGIETIEFDAFDNCPNLKSITIPRSVKTIGMHAFANAYTMYRGEYIGRLIPGFTVRGYAGTAAQKFAKTEGHLNFIPLDPVPKVGSTKKAAGNAYKISAGKTVKFKKPVSKTTTRVRIPKTVEINGRKYKVTGIADKAFVGCKKLKSVTIPDSVKQIGKCAFYNCKKLKAIRIYTEKLTKNTIRKGAFQGINKKAVFYLPKKKKNAYTKILLKRGATNKMIFKTN